MPNTCCRVQPRTGRTWRAISSASRAPPTCSSVSERNWPAPCSRACLIHRCATAGTAAVTVTPSAAMAAKDRSGSGDGSMTTRPPDSRVPRIPGQASGKLCDAGSAVR